jgi:hypothetical protein
VIAVLKMTAEAGLRPTFLLSATQSPVIAGLDPAIHQSSKKFFV